MRKAFDKTYELLFNINVMVIGNEQSDGSGIYIREFGSFSEKPEK